MALPDDAANTSPGLPLQLEEAIETLEEASREYVEAKQAAQDTGSRLTTARNTLNEAQKAMDRITLKMREQAPLDSDWGMTRREKSKAG